MVYNGKSHLPMDDDIRGTPALGNPHTTIPCWGYHLLVPPNGSGSISISRPVGDGTNLTHFPVNHLEWFMVEDLPHC